MPEGALGFVSLSPFLGLIIRFHSNDHLYENLSAASTQQAACRTENSFSVSVGSIVVFRFKKLLFNPLTHSCA
jgi:hypothetical protein